MRIDVMGVQFDNVTMDEAVARAAELLNAPGASYAVTPNAEIVYEAMHDAALRELLNGADLVLPDGSGIVLGANIGTSRALILPTGCARISRKTDCRCIFSARSPASRRRRRKT